MIKSSKITAAPVALAAGSQSALQQAPITALVPAAAAVFAPLGSPLCRRDAPGRWRSSPGRLTAFSIPQSSRAGWQLDSAKHLQKVYHPALLAREVGFGSSCAAGSLRWPGFVLAVLAPVSWQAAWHVAQAPGLVALPDLCHVCQARTWLGGPQPTIPSDFLRNRQT